MTYSRITHSPIVSPIHQGDFDFTVLLADETWEGFRIGDIAQGKVITDDFMFFCIYGQMQFSLDSPFPLTVFYNEVRNFTRRWEFKWEIDVLRPLTDAGVVREVQRHFYQCDNGVDEALEGAKCQAKNPFQHKYAVHCHIGIMLLATTQRRFCLALPGLDSCFIHPESE